MSNGHMGEALKAELRGQKGLSGKSDCRAHSEDERLKVQKDTGERLRYRDILDKEQYTQTTVRNYKLCNVLEIFK